GELNKLIKEGKIRYIGVSNFDKKVLEDACQQANIVSNQVQYSILERKIEKELVPFCKEKNISILSYGALGGGILTGKYSERPNFAKGDVRSFFYKYYKEPFWSRTKEVVELLKHIADKHKAPVAQAAVNWVTDHPEVASCLAGCRNLNQLDVNVGAPDWALSVEEVDAINAKYMEIFGKS
ncbi:MAG: aldo/keto reductase, partial [Candidatus Omnitrophica bacterium]|nr:aldo/keto reductase [Candidatus Omnitrophota bacterium]